MKTEILRAVGTDHKKVEIPTDPYDLSGIAVDYAQLAQLSFASGVLTRMQFDVPVIGSNFVVTGASWEFTAMSTALYQVFAAVNLALTSGVRYKIALVMYLNDVIYRYVSQEVTAGDTYAQSIQMANVVPMAQGDRLYMKLSVTTSDASATLNSALAEGNYINILRLWKTYQQVLSIPSASAPTDPSGGGGSHVRG